MRVAGRVDDARTKIDAEVDRMEGRGATRAWLVDTNYEYCVIMRDPEGNEFCIT